MWLHCFVVVFVYLHVRALWTDSQPVLPLRMRIVFQTHCGRLWSTAQPPVKGCPDLRATAITFYLPAEPLWTLHDFHSCVFIHCLINHARMFSSLAFVFHVFQRDNMSQEITTVPMRSFLVLSVTAVCVVKFLLEKFNLIFRLFGYMELTTNIKSKSISKRLFDS